MRLCRVNTCVLVAVAGTSLAPAALGQFASRVLEFSPAPGQFVNNPAFNDPARALGAPAGSGGMSAPDNAKIVSLGGFGGSITLAFDAPIYRNPHNPRGMDFIVFGNAFFVAGDRLRRFAEPGVVEVSRDDNANGVADDAWFLIPGSHLVAPLSRVSKTYTASALNPLWVPPGRSGTWTQSAFRLTGPPFDAPPPYLSDQASVERVWGYADLMPTAILGDTDADDVVDDPSADPARFYVHPDDPMIPGVSPGACGGSSFAIAWAINPSTGALANLDRIDFVRISTGVDLVAGVLGEVSTEVSAVADVAPEYTADWNRDALVSVQDLFDFLSDWFARTGEHGGADFNSSSSTTVQDIFDFLAAWFIA